MKINIPQGIVVFLIVATLVYSKETETKSIPSGNHQAGIESRANGMEPGGKRAIDSRVKNGVRER